MNNNTERYLVRKYGERVAREMIELHKITDMDQKIIASMDKLQKSYANCRDKKVKTVLIEYQRAPIFTSSETLESTKQAKSVRNQVPKKESNVLKTECRAIKMNGDKCTAKTKCGDFCARHMKKK